MIRHEAAETKKTLGLAGLAVLSFVALFVTRGIGRFDFWWWMSANGIALTVLAGAVDPQWRRSIAADLRASVGFKISVGLGSAIALYGVFQIGDAAVRAVFDFAQAGIEGVYGYRGGASALRIGLLIGLVIGPAEELFWRVFLQRRLQERFGCAAGFALACAVYTVVHVAGCNPMLVLAALICSVFWGWLYLRYRSALINVVSHTVWDLAAFVFFPFTRS